MSERSENVDTKNLNHSKRHRGIEDMRGWKVRVSTGSSEMVGADRTATVMSLDSASATTL